MLTIRSEAEISLAIRLCAEQCLNDINPREYVEVFGEKLSAKGWDDMDVRQVEVGTLYVIAYLRKDDSLLPKREEETETIF
jgi:hypothetical protein